MSRIDRSLMMRDTGFAERSMKAKLFVHTPPSGTAVSGVECAHCISSSLQYNTCGVHGAQWTLLSRTACIASSSMGVRGLSSYVRSCPSAFADRVNLRGHRIVIDGVALAFDLIKRHAQEDSPCLCLTMGGDYAAFSGDLSHVLKKQYTMSSTCKDAERCFFALHLALTGKKTATLTLLSAMARAQRLAIPHPSCLSLIAFARVAEHARRFFQSLLDSGVHPFVVMDGMQVSKRAQIRAQ